MGGKAVPDERGLLKKNTKTTFRDKTRNFRARFQFNFDAHQALVHRRCFITPSWATDLFFVASNYHCFLALFFARKDSPYRRDERWVEFICAFCVSMVFCGSSARWPGSLLKDDGSGVFGIAFGVSLWYWTMRVPFAFPKFGYSWVVFKVRKFLLCILSVLSLLLLFLALALQDITEPYVSIWALGFFTSLLLFETVALVVWFAVWRSIEKKRYKIPLSKAVEIEEDDDDEEAAQEKEPMFMQKAETIVIEAAESNRRVSRNITMILADKKKLDALKSGSKSSVRCHPPLLFH